MNRSVVEQAGFTLVELLIATSIFSVILLVVTFGMLNIGKIYYRGINSSNTQAVARTISDDIVRDIQFNGGRIKIDTITNDSGSTGYFCIGEKKYSFVLDRQLVQMAGQVKNAMIIRNRSYL
jgi:prepilin-type N-terminal cleavage/methylation domain-containing protein